MKILQLTVHFSPNVGGVETHLDDLVKELGERNHKVFVLTYRPLVAKSKWLMFEKRKNTRILRLPWLPGFFYTFTSSPIVEFLYLVPGLFIAAPLVLLVIRPKVIHAHGLIAGFIGVFWGKIFGKRIVVSTHSLYHFPDRGMYYTFAKWIFSHADSVLCLSNQSVDEIRRLGLPKKEQVKRFTYWIDTDVFKPLKKEAIKTKFDAKNKFVVLFVGRLLKEKGVTELLAAAKKVDDSFLFLVVGDGPLAQEIQGVAQDSGNIRFMSKVENAMLPDYYNAADVVIVPSVHDEGFGRVILESLACGTPVVGSNRGAIPDAMDNTVGELITVSPDTIATTLRFLAKDKKKMQSFSANARPFAIKRYSSKNVEEIVTEYL